MAMKRRESSVESGVQKSCIVCKTTRILFRAHLDGLKAFDIHPNHTSELSHVPPFVLNAQISHRFHRICPFLVRKTSSYYVMGIGLSWGRHLNVAFNMCDKESDDLGCVPTAEFEGSCTARVNKAHSFI
jgi:hypothetical protein